MEDRMDLDTLEESYEVSLAEVIKEFSLESVYMPKPPEEISVHVPRVNRPGLQLAGFYGYYEAERIHLVGKAETQYIEQLPEEERKQKIETFFATHPTAVVFTSTLAVSDFGVETAKKYGVPLMRTAERTSSFLSALIAFLNIRLAPRITRHGVFVEVYGEGILLLGDSGVGKSETAIELVKRGHRLVADDAVEIKRVSGKTLVGEAPENIRHYVELRGIGIVDVRRLFGMGSVKNTEKIDMVIKLEQWVEGKMYDRLGMDEEYTEILGLSVPSLTIPVRPGRNLAIIVEIAAMNNRQKKMGYNTAEEFAKRMMEAMNPV